MNYRHIYHAGAFSDVLKHSLLINLIDRLQTKDKAISLIDSHAGTGLYDLSAEEVQRNPEYEQGISRFLHAGPLPTEFQHYQQLLAAHMPAGTLVRYPGSPWFMKACLRDQDELIVNEYHPDDYQTLLQNGYQGKQIHSYQRDAYELLPAILPPKIRRGLILIDPPYEKDSEFQQLNDLLPKIVKRFATGMIMIWYPIKLKNYRQDLIKLMRTVPLACVNAELRLQDDYSGDVGLIGCGVLLFNPPWQIETLWQQMTEVIWQRLCLSGQGGFTVYRVEASSNP